MKLFIPESEWGNLTAERKQNRMSFQCLGIRGLLFTLFSHSRRWKYKSLAQRSKREEELLSSGGKARVLFVCCFGLWYLLTYLFIYFSYIFMYLFFVHLFQVFISRFVFMFAGIELIVLMCENSSTCVIVRSWRESF